MIKKMKEKVEQTRGDKLMDYLISLDQHGKEIFKMFITDEITKRDYDIMMEGSEKAYKQFLEDLKK